MFKANRRLSVPVLPRPAPITLIGAILYFEKNNDEKKRKRDK